METLDLFSLHLVLSPETPAPAPDWWGKAAHQFALSLIERNSAALAKQIHDSKTPPPFTTSTLRGKFPDRKVMPNQEYSLAISALNRPVAESFLPLSAAGASEPVELEGIRFNILRVSLNARATATSYAGLESYAGSLPGTGQIIMEFISPTFFPDGDRQALDFWPQNVFGNLLRRWNLYAANPLPKEIRDWAATNVIIQSQDLKRKNIFVSGGWYAGKTGQVTYCCPAQPDHEYWANIHLLSHYAAYAGVGGKTAMGLGQARLIQACSVSNQAL